MYHLFYSILISLANNVDNIGVRVAYSIRGVKLDNVKNLWISVITFIISTSFSYLGSAAAGAIGGLVCRIIGAAILIGLGAAFILEPRIKRRVPPRKSGESESLFGVLANPEDSDMDDSKYIDFKESTLLGLSLSINNAGGCLSAGMMGLPALLIGILSAVISFVSLWAGNYLADFFIRHRFGRKAEVVAGAVLILTGVRQLFA